MKQNLDVLKTEIQEYLDRQNFVTYYGLSRSLNGLPIVMWDTDGHPEFKDFLKAAEALGVRLIVINTREFSALFVDNALEEMDEVDLAPDEHRTIERRLREMRAYDGFTCAVELSFDYAQRAYIFELRTEWYDEFTDLVDEIDMAVPDDEDEDEGSIGGYFSKN